MDSSYAGAAKVCPPGVLIDFRISLFFNFDFDLFDHSLGYDRVFVLLGPHEGYGRSWDETLRLVQAACQAAGSNVHFCNRSTFEIGDIRILATTLWTDIDLALRYECSRLCYDFHLISIYNYETQKERKLTPADTTRWHQLEQQWLRDELRKEPHRPTVILTHHAPSLVCLEPDVFPTESSAQLSCSKLDDLFQDPVICWAYGCTHFPFDCKAGTTRLVSNPAGYPHSQFPAPYQRSYRPDLVLNI